MFRGLKLILEGLEEDNGQTVCINCPFCEFCLEECWLRNLEGGIKNEN